MLIQLNNNIFLSGILQSTNNQYLKIPTETLLATQNREMIKPTKSSTQKLRGEFIFKTCGLVNKTRNSFDIFNQIGLKSRVLSTEQNYTKRNYSTCKNKGTMHKKMDKVLGLNSGENPFGNRSDFIPSTKTR